MVGDSGRATEWRELAGPVINAPLSHMTPEAPRIVVFTPAMRTLIADAIESLILLLAEIDGDVECEADGSDEDGADMESSLGAATDVDQSIAWLATVRETDTEGERDGREPEADQPNFFP
jgi:hypothetical protein